MVIDSHVHIGKILKFNLSEETVLKSMEKYNIDFSLVSNVESSEVDFDQKLIDKKYQRSQIEVNQHTIDFARKNKEKIGALLWVKPRQESLTEEFENLIVNNRDVVYGIKVHPYHSKMPFDSDEVQEYIKLAHKYNLPVLTHTADDYCSDVKNVYKMALKYPDVKFIMAHMGLETDNKEAGKYISELPNLYGDTAWVRPKNALEIIKKCGAEKILFGTDNPIDGLDTYAHEEFYKIYFNEFKDAIGEEEYNQIMYKNAIRVFDIKRFESAK